MLWDHGHCAGRPPFMTGSDPGFDGPAEGDDRLTPLHPLYKVEHAVARSGTRWRRLSRCYEGTEASAKAWLEVAATAYLLARLRVVPT